MGVRALPLLLPAAALLAAGTGCQKSPAASAGKPAAEPRPVAVVTAVPAADAYGAAYTGVVKARYEMPLAFRVGGKVTSRPVHVGDRVAAGQVLAALDPTDYELAVKAAEAELKAAEAEARVAAIEEQRYRRLAGGAADASWERPLDGSATRSLGAGGISKSEYDARKAQADATREMVAKARRNLDIARNKLAYCTLTADADGVVTATPVDAGQVVTDGDEVVRMAVAGEKEAAVDVPEHRLGLVRTGTAVVSFWSNGGKRHPVALRELSPVADPVTRTYRARFTIPADVPGVELGMTATVRVAPYRAEPTVAVPASAVVSSGDGPFVWVVDREAGKLARTPVTVREYRHDWVLLTSGLVGGETVVRAGGHKLTPEVTVRPVDDKR